MPGYVRAMLRNPRHLFRHRNIFLLSHMRAYTSLFGHILGSHPQIEGYYEMHIGYHSWKSLWRQKMLYFATHDVKPTSEFLFDKLLHGYCKIAPEILAREHTRVIMMLRAPAPSISSICRLYRKIDAAHEYATIEGATAYYVRRLEELGALAEQLEGRFFYLDAEALLEQPDATLDRLSNWLGLSSPLSKQYQTFENTGKPQAGDSSESIMAGEIRHHQHDIQPIGPAHEVPQQPNEMHGLVRAHLMTLSETCFGCDAESSV